MAREDPLAQVTNTPAATPQGQPIPGREADMVRNDAGGYTFAKDVWNKLEDFLILGTCGGTFYLGERELTLRNTDVVFQAVREDATRVVTLAREISISQPARAPKPAPQLFALAAVFAFGDTPGKQAAREAFPAMARTTDHLAHVVGYYKQLRVKQLPGGRNALVIGTSFRKALQAWFLAPAVEDVAWRTVKARQRATPAGEKLELRDVLRIAHPKPDSVPRDDLLGWLTGKVSDEDARKTIPAIDRYLKAQALTSIQEAVALVSEGGVPWEYLPSGMLTEPAVWNALSMKVGLRALIRNLSRMSRIGSIDPVGNATAGLAVKRLSDAGAVQRARIHPMEAWLAQQTYASGRSQPHPAKVTTWQPNARVTDALDATFEAGFGAVTPSGKRLLIAVDASGSMGQHVFTNGSPVGTAYQVANTVAVILARTEPGTHVIDFDWDGRGWGGFYARQQAAKAVQGMPAGVYPSKVTPKTQLKEIRHWEHSGGGTDCSLPFKYALERGLAVDGFIILTDNETWAGDQHASQALAAYRARVNPAAKVVVASLTAAGHTIGDPGDPGVLNVAGLDASLPTVVAGFLR